MPDPTAPRWTEQTITLVLAAHDQHTILGHAEDVYKCDCGFSGDRPAGRHHLVEVVLAALADAGLLSTPGGMATCPECRSTFDLNGDDPVSWSITPEPGPEVKAVRCTCHARTWRRDGPLWEGNGYRGEVYRWPGLLANHPKLTDATGSEP